MAHLEGIRIQNYRALKDITIGKTFENRGKDVLPRFITIIGPNGSGKTSLMDALGFIGDCLRFGVVEACDKSHRGGFNSIRTRGQTGPIQFELYYREEKTSRPISYFLHIEATDNKPFVAYERLRQRRRGQTKGWPFSFLETTNGVGYAWDGVVTETEEGSVQKKIKLEDRQRLGITTLGNLADHPRIVAFRVFLENWYLSYFVPELARGLPMAGAQKHLNRAGDNLANYVQFMEREHPDSFASVLKRVAKKIPGIHKISHERQKDGRLLIQFNEKGYIDPFYQQDMSDGTLKMFAYLLLLEDPEPPPLIGIEEPENGLHHKLIEPLAKEMKDYAKRSSPQIIVTTHSPYFVDALSPQEVWILAKGNDGFSTTERASDIPTIQELYGEGIPLGSLWYSDHFGRGNP